MIELDSSEVKALVASLSGVPARAIAAVEAVTHRAAHNIKTGLAADAESDGYYPAFAASITYDRKFSSLTAIEYEVGPDKDRRQGALGNILYFGTSKNGAVLDFEGPIQTEEPKFLKALLDAASGSLDAVTAGVPSGRSAYTTRGGSTIMASDAQIAHWTRGQ